MDQQIQLPLKMRQFLWYFNPQSADSDEVKILTSFVKLVYVKSANAEGIVDSIKDALESIGIEDIFEKFVGF